MTGLWPESPGYSFGTVQSLLDWAAPLKRAGIDIIAGNPILQKAAMAVFPWMDDAANMVVFGDSRGGSANFQTFENLLTYYTGTDNKEGVEKVASALNKGISQKKYSRNNAGWTGLCTYTATIPSVRAESNERASYSPHHRFITMKNWEGDYKMMFTLYGGKKDTISLRTGWLYNSMRMVMRWLRMQRLMSPIGVKIMDTISLLQVLIRFYPDIRKEISLFMLWNLW